MSDAALSQKDLEVTNAKALLLQSKDGEPSTYDILTKVIRNILDERPKDPSDSLCHIINKVQQETCIGESSITSLQESNEPSLEVKLAEQQKSLFDSASAGDADAAEDDEEAQLTPLPDMQELLYYYEQGGVGLGREEWIRVYFALKQLSDMVALGSCRFWGKILGLEKNYYIAEVAFRDEEEYEEEQDNLEEAEEESQEEDDEEENKLPKSNYKQPPKIPAETSGQPGVNKHVYFVCNEPGEKWIRLPMASPNEIQAARQITKFLTGNLEAEVSSFPVFPGNEANLLRAQIARITAGTVIAPMTYYQFDEDEDVEDEDMGQTEFIENPDFEGVAVRDLADPSMQAWVHKELHILQQGRCIWWNPKAKDDADEEYDEEEEEPEEDSNEPEQEIGPPLLSQLSDDVEVGGLPPWSVSISSGLSHIQHSICIVKSNLWPGAVSFSNGRKYDNIYIGYGVKYQVDNFSPVQPQVFQPEYNSLPEMEEHPDPTVEEEAVAKHQNDEEEGEDEMEEEEDDD